MIISLALIDNDKLYGKRLSAAYQEFFSQVEIRYFSDVDMAMENIRYNPVDVLLVSEGIYHSAKEKVKNASCKVPIILANSKGIKKIDEIDSVCKYQRVDHINQSVMTILAEKGGIGWNPDNDGSTRVVTFMTAGGGSGCSTAAAAYSCNLASKGNKVIYVDLNVFGMPSMLFRDEGNYTMTDCIVALINQKPNLGMQLKNFARKDPSGVYYYAPAQNSLDWLDMKEESILLFVDTIITSGGYDIVVVDANPGWNKVTSYLADKSSSIYMVSEGTAVSNAKTLRLWEAASTYFSTQQKDTSKLNVIYSCFTNRSQRIKDDRIRDRGTLPFIEHKNAYELVRALSNGKYWDI
ncbi:MAG: AAA family ATPase [Ruminococcus sp.]|nr:AAA family ATPase [Ruminococcus sp.]